MKKMRKLLAVLMTLAMVMGMSITTFAANSATITVNNAGKAVLTFEQVVEPDQSTLTGWKFSHADIASIFVTSLGAEAIKNGEEVVATADQVAIAMLIKLAAKQEGKTAVLTDTLKDVQEASITQFEDAISDIVVADSSSENIKLEGMTNGQTVSKAGIYVIHAEETGYTYQVMAAYVGFGALEGETYPNLQNATIEAKKSSVEIDKEADDADDVLQIGDTINYTITTTVPYVDVNAEVQTFKITDTIYGATYTTEKEGDNVGKVQVTVRVLNTTETADDDTVYTYYVNATATTVTLGEGEAAVVRNAQTFTVDLTNKLITADNAHANKDLVITYSAVLTEVDAGNSVSNHISDGDFEAVYTGQITLTKTNEDGSVMLAGAGFKVYDKADETKAYLTFVADEYVEDEEGNLVAVPGSYTYDPNGDITEVFTGEDGKVTIKGLDEGTYHFDETTAPSGYSINEAGKDVTIADVTQATAVLRATGSIADTKLSALPSTGGIGTTIFTIGGCAIMIAAAYMFFVSRRRDEQ